MSCWIQQFPDWKSIYLSIYLPLSQQADKGPRFTGTFGIMGFFKPPRLPFDERPKLVTQDDLEQFKEQAGASLLALSRLQELDLSACPKITDSSVTQVRDT